MTSESHFRIIGDVVIKNKTTTNKKLKGKRIEISYGSEKMTNLNDIAIIQARQALTPNAPYFYLEVNKCGKIHRDLNRSID